MMLAILLPALGVLFLAGVLIHVKEAEQRKQLNKPSPVAMQLLDDAMCHEVISVETRDNEPHWGESYVHIITFDNGTIFRFGMTSGIPDIGNGKCYLNFPIGHRNKAKRIGEQLIGNSLIEQSTQKLLSS